MNYKYTDIEKFMQFTSWTDKEKIDELLRIDCSLYTTLGSDSTKGEKEEVKKKSINIYRTIKSIDNKLGDELLYTMDLKR